MKQSKGFRVLGGFKHMIAQSSVWLSAMNFLLIAATAYWTTLRDHLLTIVPWFQMWHFILALLLLWIIIMAVEYKFIYPSWIKFQNEQEYKHANLLRSDHTAIIERIAKLESKITGDDDENTDSPA